MLLSLICFVLCKMSLLTVLDLFVSRWEDWDISYAMLTNWGEKKDRQAIRLLLPVL